ncbi:MBL fold metallo-hydrolase [Clostridium sp. LP20]|uniref:MBL fold metallo-hydrolase n=1 Tax=Clostridium sp. LP20 TaxID=3418665 RepID=UPI003EE4AF9C
MQISFFWVGASTFIVEIDKTIRFACDPVLMKENSIVEFSSFSSTREIGPMYNKEVFNNIDMWLLTHNHLDHIDSKGMKVIDESSYIFLESSVNEIVDDSNYKKKIQLKWRESHSININDYIIEVTAIPAYHGNNIFMRNIIGKVNGYLVNVRKGNNYKTFYITSDTIYHKDIIKALKNTKVDYLIANLGQVMSQKFGGPITMSVDMLGNYCEMIRPMKVIPIHYNDFSHYETSEIDIINNGYEVIERGKWMEI